MADYSICRSELTILKEEDEPENLFKIQQSAKVIVDNQATCIGIGSPKSVACAFTGIKQ